jgi:predicted transcriptional regulator
MTVTKQENDMKGVLISIKPKWCELIASGKKTVEVRKTKPKLDTPFKVYIYCTKDNTFAEKTLRGFSDDGKAIYYKANKGKVIGEFVCDDITRILNFITRFGVEGRSEGELNTIAQCSCLDYMDMLEYFGTDKGGYAWHISDLVIYDRPKELDMFRSHNVRVYVGENGYPMPTHEITKPPQSWCYVEEGV